MIERYTRPAIGAVWTDEARMQAWRTVEVAASEEMDGPTAADDEIVTADETSLKPAPASDRPVAGPP